MHAFYSFATRYYTDEVHDALKDIWQDTYFPNCNFKGEITRKMFLDSFHEISEEGMLEIEVDEFSNNEQSLNNRLIAQKIPFERMHYAYDGYDAERTIFYPDGTYHTELLDEGSNPIIPAKEFYDFFVKDTKLVSTSRLTADAFFKVIDKSTLKFKRRATYFVDNEFIFIEPAKRESIEDVLALFDEGKLTQDEAFKKIAEIKEKGR